MKNNVKSNLRISFMLMKICFGFYISETVLFIYIYGWHTEAIGIEKYFDLLVSILFFASISFWILAINSFIIFIMQIFNRKGNFKGGK